MSVFYEHCPCGAEFRVEVDEHEEARTDLKSWRTEHRHEPRAGDRYADHTGTTQHTGFDAGRYGRIEDVV